MVVADDDTVTVSPTNQHQQPTSIAIATESVGATAARERSLRGMRMREQNEEAVECGCPHSIVEIPKMKSLLTDVCYHQIIRRGSLTTLMDQSSSSVRLSSRRRSRSVSHTCIPLSSSRSFIRCAYLLITFFFLTA